MMILNYESKKELKENVGNRLKYTETSFFGEEYESNGSFVGCNRPHDPRGTGKRAVSYTHLTLPPILLV